MLKKCLKYDLRWILKVSVIYFIIGLIFASLGRLTGMSDALFFQIISEISKGIAIAMIISALINNILRSGARLYNNFYKKEGYLTHTLPVKKETLLLSKFLAGVITIILSIVVAIIILLIMYYSDNFITVIKDFLGIVETNVVINIGITFILEIIQFLIIIYLGIILGCRSNGNKLVNSILIIFAIYLLSQMISLVLLIIYALLNSGIFDMLFNNTMNFEFVPSLLIYINLIYLIEIIVGYYISLKLLKKGVNID